MASGRASRGHEAASLHRLRSGTSAWSDAVLRPVFIRSGSHLRARPKSGEARHSAWTFASLSGSSVRRLRRSGYSV